MDATQLGQLKAQHEALARLAGLMEETSHCAINGSRHILSKVKFLESSQDRTSEILFIHNKDGSFKVDTGHEILTLSDKSRNALEAMSSTMAMVVKSVLNEELEEMKKAFGEIEIDGEKQIDTDKGPI